MTIKKRNETWRFLFLPDVVEELQARGKFDYLLQTVNHRHNFVLSVNNGCKLISCVTASDANGDIFISIISRGSYTQDICLSLKYRVQSP
jgi:hypothetical protein